MEKNIPLHRTTPVPQIPQSYQRGLVELKLKRIFRSWSTRKRRSCPVITQDILEVILSLLPRSDLLRAIRVSRLFFETGSPLLYASRTGVSYGDEWTWARQSASFIPRNAFAGIARPATPTPYYTPPDDDDLFLPSPMKIKLLATVRHLTWHDHDPETCDSISLPLFPSLETLTLHQPAQGAPILWDTPLLLTLRPKHVRLVQIDGNVRRWRYDWRLATAFGHSTVEKVTVHFMRSSQWEILGVDGSNLVSDIEWPGSVQQIDLVFMLPDGWAWSPRPGGRGRPVFRGYNAPSLSAVEAHGAVTALALLMASAAGTEARMRVVGLGQKFTRSSLPDGEGLREEGFRNRLVKRYTEELEKGGTKRRMAEGRAEKLELVTLEQYGREAGTIGF